MALSEGERITVALVRGLHGLRGGVRVEVLTDAPDRFRPGTVLYLEGADRPLTVAWSGPAKPGLLLRFAELTTRESVEPLRDRYLEIIPSEPLPEGTFYWHEIVGLEACTTDGEVLGRVREVFRAGAGEVYTVDGGPRGEILVPAVRAVVTQLSPADGRFVIDPAAMELPPLPAAPIPDEAGVAEPGAAEAGVAEPQTAEPGAFEPGPAAPGADEPDAPDPSAAGPGTDAPDAPEPGPAAPGADEPDAPDPSAAAPGADEPDAPDPSAAGPGTDAPDAPDPKAPFGEPMPDGADALDQDGPPGAAG